jgi:hypothetical protein
MSSQTGSNDPAPHTGRQPSPLLSSDFSFREDFLIDHFFDYHFNRQVNNPFLNPADVPSRSVVLNLIESNSALRHAVCALAATSLPSTQRPLSNERLAHLGMSLAFLRRRLVEEKVDEALLLAIIQLTDLDVIFQTQQTNLACFRSSRQLAGPFGRRLIRHGIHDICEFAHQRDDFVTAIIYPSLDPLGHNRSHYHLPSTRLVPTSYTRP